MGNVAGDASRDLHDGAGHGAAALQLHACLRARLRRRDSVWGLPVKLPMLRSDCMFVVGLRKRTLCDLCLHQHSCIVVVAVVVKQSCAWSELAAALDLQIQDHPADDKGRLLGPVLHAGGRASVMSLASA